MESTAFILMIITLLSKVTGLLREQFTAYFLGAGYLSDIYSIASIIPFILFDFVIAGVVASYIPVFNRVKKNRGSLEAEKFTSNLINILMIIATIVIVMIALFAPFIVKLFASGFEADKLTITANFTRIIGLALFISVISSIFIGYLNMKGSFIVPATAGIIMNFLNIITLYIAYTLNNFYILAIGYVIVAILKYIFFPKALKKAGFKYRLYLNFKDPYIKSMIAMSVPVIISITATDLSAIVDKNIASRLFENLHGAVASLNWAFLIQSLIYGVIIISVSTAAYPKMSKQASEGKYKLINKTLIDSIMGAEILVVPCAIGSMILASPLIKLLFERGQFNSTATSMISSIMFWYMPALIGNAIQTMTVRAFYSRRNTKAPIVTTLVELFINIPVSIILSKLIGLGGLAAGTSIAALVSGGLNLYLYNKIYGGIKISSFYRNLLKIIFSALIMGVATHYTYQVLAPINYIFAIIVSVFISIFVYAIAIIFMKIPFAKKSINKIYHTKLKKLINK